MAGGARAGGESVLARGFALLRSFDEEHPELTLSDLAERSGLPRTTAHRMASELVELGVLHQSRAGYTIGTLLWEIGELSPVSLTLRERALPHLLALYEATGENVHLAILSGFEALYVARLTGNTSIPTLSRMGGRLPLHTTGVGKALLSVMDEPSLQDYFIQPREKETIHSIVSEDELRRELALARANGYATTRQEMTLGNVSFAAPLPPVDGLPPTAVGVVTHLTRGDSSRLAPLVVRAANDIARALSH
jgi:DNA-binding IclR family transcriptional regulator